MKEKLREMQLVELDILKVFIKICEENNLKYFLMGGSLIGCVRHKGFIPWDDDIDVIMPRDDYEKFKKISKQKNILPEYMKTIFFEDLENPTVYFSRIESNKFIVQDKSAIKTKTRNAWLDIFPLDGMPKNIIFEKLHLFRVLLQRTLINYSQYSLIVNTKMKNRPLIERIYVNIGKLINWEKILNTKKCMLKFDKISKKYEYNKSKKIGSLMGKYKWKEIFDSKLFDEKLIKEFEGIKVSIPIGYDKILTQMFGDYMKMPPEEERNVHYLSVEDNINN